MQKHNGNLKPHLWCMIHWVWILSCLPCKRDLNFDVEVLQVQDDDLDSSNEPQGVCCKLWNKLNPSGTPNPIPTAAGAKWELILMKLVLQKWLDDLDHFYNGYRMCLDHWFGLKWLGTRNWIFTPWNFGTLEKREKCDKTSVITILVYIVSLLQPLFIGQSLRLL